MKRAVREQYERVRANVVLIEDKSSGTQLIQELIREGLYAVTRYKPQSDKVMRMLAQTAMIENGSVRVPESTPWLAQYRQEITVLPNGPDDDQVNSTARLLDWFKEGRRPQLQRRDLRTLPTARRGAPPWAGVGPSDAPPRSARNLACPAVFRHPPRRGRRRHCRNDGIRCRSLAAGRMGEGRSQRPGCWCETDTRCQACNRRDSLAEFIR